MKKVRILVVEDEPFLATGIRDGLSSLGYRVPTVVTSGEEAVQKAGELRPDLVLMDIELAKAMDGIAAAEQIRTRFDIPVVYLSAHADDETLQRAKKTEPFGYVVKPFQDTDLQSAIEIALYKHEMEKRLKEREERFRALVQYSSDLVTVIDADGTFCYASPSHEQVLGYSPDELVGQSLFEFAHPDDVPRIMDTFAEALQSAGAAPTMEFRFLHQDGSWRWLESTGSNQLDNPAVAGIVGNSRDITERKWAEEALQERTHDLGERVKELICLYGISHLVEKPGVSMEEILQGTVDLIPPAWHYPEITCARVVLEGREFGTENLRESTWKQSADIVVRGERMGAVDVGYLEERPEGDEGPFLREERNLLDAIARRLGRIIEQVWAEEEIQQRNLGLALLNRASQTLNSTLELDQVLATVLEEVRRLLDVLACSVWLLDPKTGDLICQQSVGPHSQIVRGWPLAPGQGLAGWVARYGESLIVPDAQVDERYFQGVGQQTGLDLRSILSVPLEVKGKVIGVLQVVDTQPDRFRRTDLELMEPLAASAATAIENARLYEQVRDGRERLQVLSRQLVDAQETERRRIAHELHDEIGQALTVVKISLQTVQRLLDPSELEPYLEEGVDLVQRTLQQVRDLSLDLRPSLLDDLGLVPALRWYVDRQAQQAGFSAQFAADPLEKRFPPDVEITCFRIVQEALTNVVRHARAERVSVELKAHDVALELVICDDGVGFDVERALARAARGASLGLLGMQERVQLVGGQIEIESALTHGTEIRARFPLTFSMP